MTPGPRRPPDRVVKDLVTAPASTYTSVERLVAMAIGDHLNADGVAWPSLPRLEAWTGLSHRSVQVAIAGLCSGPRALFKRDRGVRWRESCTYTLAADGVQEMHPLMGAGDAPQKGAPDAPLDDGVHDVPRRVHQVREKGAGGAPGTPYRTPNRTPTPPNPLATRGGARRETTRRLEAADRLWRSLGARVSRKDRRQLKALIRDGQSDGEIAAWINQAHEGRRVQAGERAAERATWEEARRWIHAHGGPTAVAELVKREARTGDGHDVWRRALERLGAPLGTLANLGRLLGDPTMPRAPPPSATNPSVDERATEDLRETG